ncbi:MAG TPA: GntG family PLP-dependent aldolase [Chloroflexota bacterium]|nr:GntG family PLP-dependent aldolase [Chloroflexota bacterium]
MSEAPVDLRSDTVTTPTAAMRRAIHDAEVGDDSSGEDPTVNRLEAVAAERLGKEAAVFLRSGTMGNLVGLVAHTRPGDEVIVGHTSHILMSEVAGAAILGSLQLFPIPTHRGVMDPADVTSALRDPSNPNHPRSRLVSIENTANKDGGAAVSVQDMDAVADVAHRHGLRVHVDGARIFNASVALDVPVDRLVQGADSVTFCLSKGLGCPMGSILAGDAAYIKEARRWRKIIGASLRQTGVVAAAGLYALDHMVDRLAEDHANARRLAEGLSRLPGLAVDLDAVETNIIMLSIDPPADPASFVAGLLARGVRVGAPAGRRLRLVTHHQVTAADVDHVLAAAERSLSFVAA